MYASVEYISTSGTIPILPRTPFIFNDNVPLKSEKELTQMEFSSLVLYSSTLSTSIAYQTSTLLQNSRIQGLYSYLKRRSQSTINGLNSEINVNTAKIAIYNGIANQQNNDTPVWEYDGLEWIEDEVQKGGGKQSGHKQSGHKQSGGGATATVYVSTLDQFDYIIGGQLDYIATLDSTMLLYKTQYASSMSSLNIENSTFNSTATAYSTAVWIYEGYQNLYTKKQTNQQKIIRDLSDARTAEQKSAIALDQKNSTLTSLSDNLSTLYDRRLILGKNITQYRIKESDSYIKYVSSLHGLSTTSSVYYAAIINEKYAIALSDLTANITDYSDALNLYNAAQLAWEASITSGPSSPSGPSGAGNSALRAARDMAEQRRVQKLAAKVDAEASSSKLLNLATLANTAAYEAMLVGYDSRIDAYMRSQQKFKQYSQFSLQEVARFSSIYEKARTDISKYTGDIKLYSTLYESSIISVSTLLGLSDRDNSTIRGESNAYDAVSLTIEQLTRRRKTLSDQYDQYINNSSFYTAQYYSSLSNVSLYKSMYASTNDLVNKLRMDLYGAGGSITQYYTMLFMNSTMLNDDKIAKKVYDSDIMDLVNQQDGAMYQYRETFCHYKRAAYQQQYETNIYAAVEFAQSNALPIANLETDEIRKSRDALSNINLFLKSFSNLYGVYDTQYSNITQISTSVGYESNAWSTVNSYTWKSYFNIAAVDPASITTSCKYLTLQQNTTTGLLETFASQQSNIDTKKLAILSGLQPFFTPEEIDIQTKTISSFITDSAGSILTTIQQTGSYDLTWTDQ